MWPFPKSLNNSSCVIGFSNSKSKKTFVRFLFTACTDSVPSHSTTIPSGQCCQTWQAGYRPSSFLPSMIRSISSRNVSRSCLYLNCDPPQSNSGVEGASRISTSGGGEVHRCQANNTKAAVWLRKTAATGFPIAQTDLGEMLFRGHGLNCDPSEARRLLESASEANYPRAKLD